jgi:hypothetical protein
MVDTSKQHNSALCHVATTLLTRVVARWRAQAECQIPDVDGRPSTPSKPARIIIRERYTINDEIHRTRNTTGWDRRSKESHSAPLTSAVPESVGGERNRAASASSSGHAVSEIAVFSLPATCFPVAIISSAI